MHNYLDVNALRLLMDSQGTLSVTPEGKGRSLSGTSGQSLSFLRLGGREENSHKDLYALGCVVV
jgi:hypothetical protein